MLPYHFKMVIATAIYEMTELEFWNARLNDMRSRCDPQTDVQLSFAIRISPAMISQIRSGRREPPFDLKVKLLEALGYVLDHDLLIRLLPMDHRRIVMDAMRRSTDPELSKPQSHNHGKELPPLQPT